MQAVMNKAERVLSTIMHMMPKEEIEKIKAEDEEKLKTEPESESEDEEGEYENEDRWNCARPGREADAVNKIKEIIEFLHKSVDDPEHPNHLRPSCDYEGWSIVATTFDDPTIARCGKKFAIAFIGWLMLSEHKLDGTGGHWSSGCFGSFWADIALTIPDIQSYCGFRVAFNPKPCPSRPAWFCLDFAESLPGGKKEITECEPTQTSAMCASYGVRKDWGLRLMTSLRVKENLDARANHGKADAAKQQAKAKKLAEKAEKAAKKAEKLREEEMARRARDAAFAAKLAEERRAQEEEIRVAREAEFAARVAAVAEREKAAKEQERLAKLEQARISEENRKLKAQQKEAERIAKFVNKKK